jgi:hypothetical protein
VVFATGAPQNDVFLVNANTGRSVRTHKVSRRERAPNKMVWPAMVLAWVHNAHNQVI